MRSGLLILGLWFGGLSHVVGCAPSMMHVEAPHKPPLKRVHQGDAAFQETPEATVNVTTFLSLGDKKDTEILSWMTTLMNDEKSSVRWVFKHRSARGNQAGSRIARALLAAQEQGKFWELLEAVSVMKGKKNSPKVNIQDSTLYDLAQGLGLDMKRYEKVLNEATTKARLDADSGLGVKLGLPPAPVLLVNGRMVVPTEEKRLKAVLVEERRKAKRLQDLGVPGTFVSALLTDLNRSEERKVQRVESKAKKAEGTTSFPVGYSNAHLALGAQENESLVTLVVFHDYQCTFSRKHGATVDSLLKSFPKELRVIIRHNPLTRHKHAKGAAAASLAAVEMGAGEAYHRGLLLRPKELHKGGLLELAVELGLDPLVFENAMERHESLVEMDVRDAKIAQAKGTPHSFINGRKIRGAVGRSSFLRVIRQELKRAKEARVKTNLEGRALYDHLVDSP